VRVLSEGFHSAADPDISFNGRRILFSGQRLAGDPWNVHELDLDTGALRQITHEPEDCRTPIYQSALYTIDSPEPWYQVTFVRFGGPDEAGGGPGAALYSCRPDGSELRRITFNPSRDLDPLLLPDGRILFAARQRADLRRGPAGRIALFGINLDGTDLAAFAADEGARFKRMPAVTPDRLVVFVESGELSPNGAGQLAAVTLRRSLHSHRRITDDRSHRYRFPAALPDGTLLASRCPTEGGSCDIVRVDPGDGAVRPAFDDPAFDDLQARPVVARPEPDGRSSVVNEKDPAGRLYGLDVRISDLGDVWARAELERLRVLEGVPGAGEGALVPRRILGEVDLEPDGSFNVQIPANVPVQLQIVDDEGMALRSCSWIWARDHEPRGCIGCHEDGERTPPNHLVDAVTRESTRLTLPSERRRTVDFRRDVMPVIGARCAVAGCHAGSAAPPALDAGAREVYDALTAPSAGAPAVHPVSSRTSPLTAHLFGRWMGRPWDGPPPERAPGPAVDLSPAERRLLLEWIDLGASWSAPALPEEEAP
jgi:hypothetical protein